MMSAARGALAAAIAACALLASPRAFAAELPPRLDPPAPFPAVLSQAPVVETIAPGIGYAEYALVTAEGPVVVRVASIAPHRSDVRVEAIAAHDRLTSSGETVSSMAARTGAVAGVNGDYYDIGNTNRPTNVLIRDGRILHTPDGRYALVIDRGGTPAFSQLQFTGQVEVGANTVGLDAVNEMPPPHGGTSMITPEFGRVPPEDNLTLVALTLLDGTPPFARYRASSPVDNLQAQPPGYYLAVGSQAYGPNSLPNPGDIVAPGGDFTPVPLDSIAGAIGGGPLILRDGSWFDDPNGPSGGEYAQRIPSTGAAITPDGTLMLVEVDGRQPSASIGLTRPEFAALMRGLGAVDGMAFDGGGSSAIAARRLGDGSATLQTSPSDGKERDVADGIFAFSTAPVTAAVRVVGSPALLRAAPGASINVRAGAVDAAQHLVGSGPISGALEPASLGTYANGRFTAHQPGSGALHLRSGALHGEIPVDVVATPARIAILPANANVADGGTLQLTATATNDAGYPIALPEKLHWTATGGAIDDSGTFRAGRSDGTATVDIGGRRAQIRVTVGSHDVALQSRPRFSSVPPGGEGESGADSSCGGCIFLSYALGPSERAAYAVLETPLPAGTIAVGFRVRISDATGSARLRVSLRNAINESVLLDAIPIGGASGWQDVTVRLPATFAGPGKLTSLYVVRDPQEPVASGTVVVGNLRAVVAGHS